MKLLHIIFGILVISCNSKENQSVHIKSDEIVGKGKPEITEELQNGDLIFHTSQSSQSKAIQIATDSKYSHVGIVYKEGEEYFVYEAIQPVQITKLVDWVNRGEDGKYVVKRLKDREKYLTEEGIQELKKIGKKYIGKDYDFRFEWSDDKIYCSELAWKIYKEAFNIEIGKLEKIEDFDLSNMIVQNKLHERYGNEIPKDELVITPDRMFKSEKLITIKEE